MKAQATVSSTQSAAGGSSTAVHRSSTEHQSHGATFTKVFDGRKQPIRGLWQRNGRFYAQLKFEDGITGAKKTRRVPLTDKDGVAVASVAEARAALEKLRTQRCDNTLPVLHRTPTFSEFADRYLDFIKSGADEKMKGAETIKKEAYNITKWKAHLGNTRLDKIKLAHVKDFTEKRKIDGKSNRTVNLDVTMFRNVMQHAIDAGHITAMPTTNLRRLKVAQRARTLFTPAELEKLCTAAKGATKNAVEFVDYLRFLAYTGARRNEALRVRWQDVDFAQGQLTIGAEGNSKNSKPRVVDFNDDLKRHLSAMKKRSGGVSAWLFPSPQRGEQDIPAKDFRESLMLARKAAGVNVGFHDLRHLFISFCVMSGIDYMTIARWVGHRDGGVLIGKVYGHLSDSHAKAQAKRVSFGPTILKEVAA